MTQENVKAAMLEAIDRIKADPAMAKLVFRAEAAWEEDVRCKARIRQFPELTIDEPPELGGQNAGPNPVEVVLAALGACQEIIYSAYASVMGVQLNAVSCKLRGYIDLHGLFGLDSATPPGFTKIAYETTIDSPADPDVLRKLIEVVEAHCPVLDTIRRPVDVVSAVKVNGQPVALEAAG